jgi:GWxTD domain-containing protein
MAVAAATPAPQQSAAPMSTSYEKWLREDVVYIITEQERAAFVALTSDAERDNFIEQFWQRRDPTPGTPENEFRDEHYRRIAYVNEHFAGSVAGWKTDRGRTYIVYGPPDEIDDHSSGGSYERPPEEGGGKTSTYPFQQWRYRYIEGIGTNIIIEFVDHDGSGDYRMTKDPHEKEKASTPYRKWLNEDAAFIITEAERAAFLKLSSDEERKQFIESFWQRRGEPFREEHYRRIAYANEHFSTGIPGWKTDRGSVYVTYGPPDAIENGDSRTTRWTYRWIEGKGSDFTLVFTDSDGRGEFRLTNEPGEPQENVPPEDAKLSLRFGAHSVVTVLVPLGSSQDHFHVYLEITGNRKIVFESEVSGQAVFTKSIPLPVGQYRLAATVKDLDSGAIIRPSELSLDVVNGPRPAWGKASGREYGASSPLR